MIRLALALAIVFAGANCSASAQNVTIIGGGLTSCGDWVRFRAFEDRQDNIRERGSNYQLQSWLHGFLSGYNVGSPGQMDYLADPPSLVAMAAWVDNYCKANPLNRVAEAAGALIKELRSRAERK